MRLYRWLLRAFPPEFRARFGEDMTDVFRDRWRDARRRGVFAAAACLAATIVDVAAHAAAERRAARAAAHSRGPGGPGGRKMSGFIDDLAGAARSLRRRPLFSLAAASMLAVGLGFNIALFAVVNAVVLKPLPYTDANRIAMLWTGRNPDGFGSVNSYADFADWQARTTSFDSLAVFNIALANLTNAGDPEEIAGSTVSPDFFRVLGARVALGRALEPGDEKIPVTEGRPIVIADSLWRRRFNADPGIVGRTITINGNPRRVAGVLDRNFRHPEPFWDQTAEFWAPLGISDQMRQRHDMRYLRVIGRLKPGVTLARAGAEMDTIGRQLMAEHPITNTKSVIVAGIHDELMGDTRMLLWLFLAAVSLVLLLAMANIVNLLLARANGRGAEFALRTALGATRGRLISYLVAEGTALGVLGGALGLAFAEGGILLIAAYGPTSVPGIETTSINGAVLAFAVVISALTGALCGLLPAIRAGRGGFAPASASSGRAAGGVAITRSRVWLVAAEMALAVPLLVGAGLLTETLVRMQRIDPGFDPNHTLQFRLNLTGPRYDSAEKQTAFFTDVRARLSGVPGASAVGMVSSLPMGGLNNTAATFAYTDTTGVVRDADMGFRAIAGAYFETLAIPLREGRLFDDASDKNVVIINDVAARKLWGDENPIGRQVRFGQAADADPKDWLTVVGVVGSLRHNRLTEPATPELFQPYRANTWSAMTVTVRTAGDPALLAAGARNAVHALDPLLPVVDEAPVSALVDHQLARPRFGALCSGVFGGLGLALAAFGTFAVLSLLVAQRTREIGIRMALGASRVRVAAMVMRESLLPVVAGCALGAAVAAFGVRALASQLFGVAPRDPFTFAGAIGVLTLAACAASWWPTHRAATVDPVKALRAD